MHSPLHVHIEQYAVTGGVAENWLPQVASHGVDLESLGEELQAGGDEKFADAFDRLLDCIQTKIETL